MNGKTYTTTTDADGKWSVGVPAADVTALEAGTATIKAEVSDTAGNKGSVTRDITTDLTGPAVAIDRVTADDIINAAEKGADLTLTGTCGSDVVTVKVTLNGKTYDATVTNGSWTLTVPKADMAKLADGIATVTALATDTTGNTTTVTRDFSVAADSTHLPTVTINALGDDLLNAAEVAADQTITGKVTNAAEGDTVKVTLNSTDYTATVAADLTWSVTVPAADLAAIAEGKTTLTAEVTAANGNTGSATRDITVDTSAPVITIDKVAGDDIVNAKEHNEALFITGSTTGALAGDKITVTIGDKNYETVAGTDGKWQVALTPAEVKALTDDFTVTATVTDTAKNQGSSARDVVVHTTLPVITIDTVSTDDVINVAEKGQPLTISGTCDQPGATISLSLNGQTYSDIIADADGKWSVTVPAEKVNTLSDGAMTFNASVTDADGNEGTASHTITVDTQLPGIAIDTFCTDNIIDATEIGSAHELSGTVTHAKAGDIVTLHIGAHEYTATVQADLTWKVSISSADLKDLGDGLTTITAEVTNACGNTGSGKLDVSVQAGLPGLHVNPVTGDNVVNAIEHSGEVNITGSCSGYEAGTTVSVTVNGQAYSATVEADGLWSLTVPAADVALWDGLETIVATATNAAGEKVTEVHNFTVDLSGAAIVIDPITEDNVINAKEKGESLTLSGATTGIEAGQFVTIRFAGKSFDAQVDADGKWSVNIDPEELSGLESGAALVVASVSNVAGDTCHTARAYLISLNTPDVHITSLAGGDNVVNIAEHEQSLIITGDSSATPGCKVIVTLNGQNYETVIKADGTWQVTVPAEDVQALDSAEESYNVQVSVTDRYGNPGSTESALSFDRVAPEVTIDPVTDDNVINNAEHSELQVISGSSKNATPGDVVEITIDGHTWKTYVEDDGTWSYGVPASVIITLANGEQNVTVTITDKAGNSASSTRTFTVNTTLPSITIETTVAGDDIINAQETKQPLTISGTTDAADGSVIIVSFHDGQSYTAIAADGAWEVMVPVIDLQGLEDGEWTITAMVIDSDRNHAQATHEVTVDTKLPVITFDTFATDNQLNYSESQTAQTLSGHVTNLQPGDTITIKVGDKTYSDVEIKEDLSWSISLPVEDLAALAQGEITITAGATTTPAGNHTDSTLVINVDTVVPVITINTIAGDNTLNNAEYSQAQIVSGSVTGAEPGDKVTITLGNKTYTVTLDDDNFWSVGISAADLALLSDGTVDVKVSVTDKAGNSAEKTQPVVIDTVAPVVTIDAISEGVINLSEQNSALEISGTCNADTISVKVTFNGVEYTAECANGIWAVTVPADVIAQLASSTMTATVVATDAAGNTTQIAGSVIIDFTTPAITIHPLGDDTLNAAETGSDQTLSGTVSGAKAGDKVTVFINGVAYGEPVEVKADLTWEITIAAEDLADYADGALVIDASVTNSHGNTGESSRTLTVDTTAPTIEIINIAVDDILNINEHSTTQIITGKTTGVEEGTKVTVTLNGKEYFAWTDADGNWQTIVSADDIAALPQANDISISAKISDKAGNSATAEKTLTVDLTPPELDMNKIAGDDIINATEKNGTAVITGTCDQPGATVSITLNGTTWQTVADSEGNWSVTLPADAVAALPEGKSNVLVAVTDESGNETRVVNTLTVDTRLPVITINTFCGDNIIDETEIGKDQLLSGKVSGASAGDTVIIHVGTHDYTATVGTDLKWSVRISAADLKELGEGPHSISVEVTNTRGNTGTAAHDISIQAGLPGIYIMKVTGDDVINAIEMQENVAIAGACTGLDIGTQITVSINGKDYTAVVQAGNLWAVDVPAADVALWTGTEEIIVTAVSADNQTITGTHNITVDNSAVAIVINRIATDNVINAAEKGEMLVISGKTTGIEANQLVDITFAGKAYQAVVKADGTWSITVSATDMISLENGVVMVDATAKNAKGEDCSSSRAVLVATDLPTVQIITMAGGDSIINIAESTQPLVINGTTGVPAGCKVEVVLNGKTYSTTAKADGTWSLTVPAADVEALTHSDQTVTVNAYDRYGNKGTSSSTLSFDLVAPTATFDVVAGDDVINTIEQHTNLIISGSSKDSTEGDLVTLQIGAKTYTTTVDAEGKWTVGVPASVISALPEGENSLKVTIADKAGNSATTEKIINVIPTLPEVTINTVAGDDIINAAEAGKPVVISGTSNAADGSPVVVSIGGKTWNATVTDGKWSVTVPVIDLNALASGEITVTASVKDEYQNSNATSHTVTVDKNLPVITFDNFATDNIVNVAEALVDQTLSGHAQNVKAGDTLVIHVGTHTYEAVVQSDLSWSVSIAAKDIQSLGDGEKTITADVQTASGNTGSASLNIIIDAGLPELVIGTVSGDNVINALEHNAAVVIQGTCSNVTAGSIVTITIDGVAHEAVVQADGKWQVAFTADEVSEWPAGSVEITASVNNAVGNTTTVAKDITVDLDGPAITINPIAQDNYINAAEKAATLTLTGATIGVEAGCTVVVKFGGKSYTTKVDATGAWKVDVSASDMTALLDGNVTVEVSVVNKAGNRADASQDAIIDSKAPLITIDPIAVDNIINQAEHSASVVISGTSDVGEGKTVSIELNGKTYTALTDAQGKWTVSIPAADVSALTDGVQNIKASVSDDAGNIGTNTAKVTVDTQAPTLAFEDWLFSDDIINTAEHELAQVVSGTSTGLAEGTVVVVKLSGPNGYSKTFVTSVDDVGDWAIGLDAKTIRALANGDFTFTANAMDAAGNPAAQAEHAIKVDTIAPVIAISTTSAGSDDVLNKVEKQTPFIIQGSTDLEDGAVITVTLNGKTYNAEANGGAWSLTIPASDLASLADGSYTVHVIAKDASGNTSTTSKTILVDTQTPVVVISNVTSDNIINSTEAASDQQIYGKVINGAAGDTITVTLNGKTYTTTVNADMTWSVNVPSADLGDLNNGKNTVTVTVTDNHGNISENYTHDFGVAIRTPIITVDTLSGDGVVNKLEHAQSLIISGSAQNLASGDVITVVVSDGTTSKTYYGTVQEDGKTWMAVIPQADVTLWENNATITVTATGKDAYGNMSDAETATAVVNLNQVAITIDPVTADNIVNAAEAADAAGLKITGSTYNAANGDTVTITFNGKEYTANVSNPENQAYGYWTFTIPQEDLTGLKEGNSNIIAVELSSGSGNTAIDARLFTYDPMPPTVLINPITGDNVLIATELGQPLVISGTASQDAAGQTITVTFNELTYTATVNTDGTWSVSVPVADLAELSNGYYDVKAEVSDKSGNPGVTNPIPQVNVRIAPPQVFIDPVSEDNYINAVEHKSSGNLVITGRTLDAEEGAEITLVFNGASYKTTVQADGTWSVSVSAAVVKGLADGEVLVDASIDDGHGNIGHATQVKVIVDTSKPLVTVDTIATDNVINDDERADTDGLTLTGTGSVSEAGQTVTVVFTNGTFTQSYTTTLDASGKWSLNIPQGNIASIESGDYTVTATITDKAGNEGTGSRNVKVDDSKPAIAIDAFTGDDFVNKAEHNKSQIISGTTDAPAGKTVMVILGEGTEFEKTYTATVTSDGKWSVTVPGADLNAFTDGNYRIVAKVDNAIGNHGSAGRAISMDVIAPTIAFAANVAGDDNVVNMAEQVSGIHVGGVTTAEEGQTVTVKFNNGNSYSAIVSPDGTWAVDIPASEFTNLSDGYYPITAVVSDKAGNKSDTAIVMIGVSDLTATLEIDPFTGDNRVNASELAATQHISGTTDAEDDSVVTITLNGKTYTAVVSDGIWTVDVSDIDLAALTDGSYEISASITNSIGNTVTVKETIIVDTVAPTQIVSIDSITEDRGVSTSDFLTSDTSLVINGSLSAALGSNDVVQISLDNGVTWNTVTVDGLNWSYSDPRTLEEGTHHYQVRVIDKAGNVGSQTAQDVVVDTTAPTTSISVASITTDTGYYNDDFITSDTTLTVHGTVSNALSEGEYAQISLDGGVTWQALTMTGTDWEFDCGTRTSSFDCKVRIIDAAGNVGGNDARTIVVDTAAPNDITVAITSISDDTGIAADFKTKDTSLTINGTLSRALASDELLQISMDDGATWVNVACTDTDWSYIDSRTLTDGSHTYKVQIVDLAGNISATADQDVTVVVDTQLSDVTPAVTGIDEDTGISDSDFITNDTSITMYGTLSGVLADNEWAEISVDGGFSWVKVTMDDDTHWHYADPRTLDDGDYFYKIRITDDVGNISNALMQKVTVDTTAPTKTASVSNYTDDVGTAKGNYGTGTTTDDPTPKLNGTLNQVLAAGERVGILRDGVLIGYATVTGTSWSFSDDLAMLAANTYHYKATVMDDAGNMGVASTDFNIVYKPVPGVKALVTAQTTTDKTPLITGTLDTTGGDFLASFYLEVKVNNKTYTSKDGTVVVDIANKTWYLQIPDADAFPSAATGGYTVSTAVKTIIGDTTGPIATGTVTEQNLVTPTFTLGSVGLTALSYTLNSDGSWYINTGCLYKFTDPTKAPGYSMPPPGYQTTINIFADFDRNGVTDLLYMGGNPGGLSWSKSISGYTNLSAAIYGGAMVVFDKNGDGYLDGVATKSSNSSGAYWINNTNGTLSLSTSTGSTAKAATDTQVTSITMGTYVSAVDLDNDGKVDIAAQTYNGNAYAYSALINNGDGTFTWGQSIDDFFATSATATSSSSSRGLFWADFNNDGYMDLYTQSSKGSSNAIFLNNGDGTLVTTGVNITGANTNTVAYLVDWNHDGYMDIIKSSSSNKFQLLTNSGDGKNFTVSTITSAATADGVLALVAFDYDWDGDEDILTVGSTNYPFITNNTNTVEKGTALHFRILDQAGFNVYYGNTVNLYDSKGNRVATQTLNPQYGAAYSGSNTSGIVSFYGLDPSESYSIELLYQENGVSKKMNATVSDAWGDIHTGEANECYILNVGTTGSGTTTGTGYNDILMAKEGSATYNGGGGTILVSDVATWQTDGGLDVIDFKLANTGVTVDLAKTTAQNTGFNTVTLTNIEGVYGSNSADTLSGSTAGNVFEGRGGNDAINISQGGHDTLLYRLINNSVADDGGVGHDVITGFKVGAWESTPNTSRIDVHELLNGYTGNGSAHYINNKATLDSAAGNLADFVKVVQNGDNVEIQIDRDGSGNAHNFTTIATLNNVQTDLATLLANHQLTVV
ncbi:MULTISPECIES: Ig-like domain-containing protein [Citrobacter]|uniref:Ig-like domain-containing protein n=1 Tax=Citrobacter TaxID=544 RepID=UPI001F1289F2|nr:MULTISPECIES: Ig-like domain-containing protein [Citrobacter]